MTDEVRRDVVKLGLDFRAIPVDLGDGVEWEFNPDPSPEQWSTLVDALKQFTKFEDEDFGGDAFKHALAGFTNAMADMAGSVASSLKSGINNAIGLPKSLSFNVLGKKIGFTIPGFEKGGITPGGMIAVGEGGPELLQAPRGSRVYSNAESKKMMESGGRYALTITNWRTGQGYMERIADDRISASDNLAWRTTRPPSLRVTAPALTSGA